MTNERSKHQRSTSATISSQEEKKLQNRINQFDADNDQILDLSNLNLTKIPPLERFFLNRSWKPNNIKVLEISLNKLRELPYWLMHLRNLEFLLASHNKMQILPEYLGEITVLKYLDVRDNKLWALPSSIMDLTALKKVYLHRNFLDLPPEVLGIEPTFEVNEFRRYYLQNYLQKFTNSMISDFPEPERDSIKNDVHRSLNYYGSRKIIEQVYLASMSHLKKNKLTGFDIDNIFRETNLVKLVLQSSYKNSDQLAEDLGVSSLSSEFIIDNIQGRDPEEVLSYYFRVRAGKRSLNEAKLIFVGFGAVGKTSLANRLVYDLFNTSEEKTEGIQITQWPIKINSNEDVRLHIWDFGGQEIMHATHQFFLTSRSLYLLVLSGRQGREDVDSEYWLNLTEGLSGRSPVIVVLNKIREHPFTINRNGLLAKFPQIKDFVETDCGDKTGIEELRQAVFREVNNLEHLRDAFPSSWFDIKNRIAGMEEDYITFDDFRGICSQLGEHDSKAHDELAFYLHNLGIALNYKDDPRLQDTHVLNPRWVTNGIYAILNSGTVAARRGEMLPSDLALILNEDIYPRGRHGFLIDLMRKFELCFSFDQGDRYLIPELLEKDQPAIAEAMEAAATLRFQYCYEGEVPEGLMPRFIVRTHTRSGGQPRWRTGVILQFEGSTALVKAEPSDKRVIIAISGKGSGPRRLLGIIRDHFDSIHASYRRDTVREMVPVPNYPEIVIPYEELHVLEDHGVELFPKVVGNTVVNVVVKELLNGVEMTSMVSGPPLHVFFSYSHKDEELRDELATHLSILKRQGLIEQWHDRDIVAGEDWKGKIKNELEQADIILLLVSSDFIASEYCYDVEMHRAMERQQEGKARVIPIILRECNWQLAPFGRLQALPTDGKAVKSWPSRDKAWRNVEQGIMKAINELQARGASSF